MKTVQVLGSKPGGLPWPGQAFGAQDTPPGFALPLYVPLANTEVLLDSLLLLHTEMTFL